MPMTTTAEAAQADQSPFSEINQRLAGLRDAPALPMGDGHRDLAEGVWLSIEPGRGAAISFTPVEQGFRLHLGDVARARWVALGFTLPAVELARGKYIGLRLRAKSDGFFSYRPALRYLDRDGGFADQFSADHQVSSGGAREKLSYIPINTGQLAQSAGAEINIFFQGTTFDAEIEQIEVLLLI